METYTKQELKDIAKEFADVEIHKFLDRRETLHFDFTKFTDLTIDDLPEQIECSWTYLDEEDFNNLSGTKLSFIDLYGNREAKVMIITLPFYSEIGC